MRTTALELVTKNQLDIPSLEFFNIRNLLIVRKLKDFSKQNGLSFVFVVMEKLNADIVQLRLANIILESS